MEITLIHLEKELLEQGMNKQYVDRLCERPVAENMEGWLNYLVGVCNALLVFCILYISLGYFRLERILISNLLAWRF